MSKIILERNLKVLLSKYYFDRNCSICEPAVVFIMSPPPQPNQLVDLFSPNPTIPPSGRSTPSSVGGAASGRASALTIDSSSAISWGTQGIDMTIRPIPKQGSISYFDPDALNSKKPSGRGKRVLPHTVLWSTWRCYQSCPKFLMPSIAVRAPLRGIKSTRG